jgi:putative FmdB family regulatory protein
MPIYDFVCHDCKLYFEKEYSMKKAPSRSKCPECNKLSNRDYQDIAIHFKGDCYTNRRKAQRGAMDQQVLGRHAEMLVNKTKESLDVAKSTDFYAPMVPGDNFQEHYSDYKFKKLNTKEKEERDRRLATIGKKGDKLGSYHKHKDFKRKDDRF